MGRFVINMDECSLHVGKDLNRVLELLANIMCFPQRRARIHDDVDLNKVVWATLTHGDPVRKCPPNSEWGAAYVVRANGIDLFNLVAERHRLVNQELNEVMRGGFSGQKLKLLVDPVDPSATDASANL